jgi:hypothetical protein
MGNWTYSLGNTFPAYWAKHISAQSKRLQIVRIGDWKIKKAGSVMALPSVIYKSTLFLKSSSQ